MQALGISALLPERTAVYPKLRRELYSAPVAVLPVLNLLRTMGVFLVGAVLLTACGQPLRPQLTDIDIPTATSVPATPTESSDQRIASNSDVDIAIDLATVATATSESVDIFQSPSALAPLRSMTNPTVSGGPLVFLVEQTSEDWHEVLLPVRPNGSTGWIRADDVSITRHNYRLDVNLSDFELKIFNGGRLEFQATVAVARDNSPTPGGRYYITELLQPLEPNSVYGSFAYGLSGYSETFETFNGGPGQLGIHGTNDPNAIGSQASAGCVRLANGDIAHLVGFLPLGTPVTITP